MSKNTLTFGQPIYETQNYTFYFLDIGEGYVKIKNKENIRSEILSLDELENLIKEIKEKRKNES